jgi:type II secretory pathway pseudopilin PulG
MRLVESQTGASFVEIVTAISVFALVAIGLSPALLGARRAADLGKDQSIATALAQDKIEQIRQMTASAIATGSDGPLQANGSANGIFNRNWTVTANSPVAGVSRVDVTVTWAERGTTGSVTVGTLTPQ